MKTSELLFDYPEHLVATEPRADFRTLFIEPSTNPREISKSEIFSLFKKDDVLLINDSRVQKCRLFASDGLEVLFVQALSATRWEVLLPARNLTIGQTIALPGDVTLRLVAKGLPQIVESSRELTDEYFETHGALALPPYIQKARGERRPRVEDEIWYQTAWAKEAGSKAAPTASLHFTQEDLQQIANRAQVLPLTLHIGLGTFLPVKTENITEHAMHSEQVRIPSETWRQVQRALQKGGTVWALGTTAMRAIEAAARGDFKPNENGDLIGPTDLFITPGFDFKIVGGLLTNFHQPGSTLIALVAAFAGLDRVLDAYRFAIAREFRLFSYGDLSIWRRANLKS